MSSKVAGNAWGEILHHETDAVLELRWLPSKMTDGAFKATLAQFAWEAERLRPEEIWLGVVLTIAGAFLTRMAAVAFGLKGWPYA